MEPNYADPDPMKKAPPAYPGPPPPQPHPGTDPGYGPRPSAYPNQPGPSTYPPYPVYQLQQPVYPQPQPQAWGELPPPMYPPPAGPPMGYGYGPPPPLQQQQQQVVVMGGTTMAATPIVYVESFVGQIVLSCFVSWCCNLIFGLIAFVLAMMANSSAVFDPIRARSLGRASIGVSIAGIVFTVVLISIVVSVAFGRAAQVTNDDVQSYGSRGSGSSSTVGSCNYNYNSTCYQYYTYTSTRSQCYLNGYYYNNVFYYNKTCYYNL